MAQNGVRLVGCRDEHKVGRFYLYSYIFNTVLSRLHFGVTYAGEFSNGYNDCGLFLRGVQGSMGPTTYGGNCSFWEDSTQWNETTKAGIERFGMASMDALRDYFFWTWKASNCILK